VPAPANAGPHPVAHIKRGKPERSWVYVDALGARLGVVYRFRTSDGGKEVLPCVFAEHAKSTAREWRWLGFPEPRPLYGLLELANAPEAKVLIVEGEKCADAARELLGAGSIVVSPGPAAPRRSTRSTGRSSRGARW
jgi:putative DNA primase/helicase